MDELLRSIQLNMLDALKVFDKLCRDNGIHYSLHGGTLLGAVRHKGFIPWDDDLDVFMTRKDFDLFVNSWNRCKPEGYFLQTKEVEEDYTRSFAKIRKEHTLFLQDTEKPDTIHTGIFIDIFPVDKIPERGIGYYLFLWNCMKYQLYTREFVPPKGSPLVKFVSGLLLRITNHKQRMRIRENLYKKITKYNSNSKLRWAVLETPWHIEHSFSPDIFDSYEEITFEDQMFMCIGKWKELLETWYGDYMTMPPEKDRVWAHHPKAVSLDCDYAEYMEKQGELK